MATELDEVADRLAQQPLAVRHSSNRLLAHAEERRGLVGITAFAVGAVGMAVSIFRRYPRVPDQLTTRRLYEQATGVDRDRANADLDLVTDRLSPLVSAPDGPQGDALLLGASRCLVAWVAAGRIADRQMSAVEATFADWVQVAEDYDADPEAFVDRLGSYVDAWDAACDRQREGVERGLTGPVLLRVAAGAGTPHVEPVHPPHLAVPRLGAVPELLPKR